MVSNNPRMAVSQAGVRPVLLTCALLALALSGALSVALSAPRGTARTRRTSSLGLSSYHSIVSTPEAPGTVLAALKSRGRLRTFFQHARGMLKRALPTYHSASGGQPGTGQAAVKRTSVTLGLLQHAKGILRRALFEVRLPTPSLFLNRFPLRLLHSPIPSLTHPCEGANTPLGNSVCAFSVSHGHSCDPHTHSLAWNLSSARAVMYRPGIYQAQDPHRPCPERLCSRVAACA